jgi:hypothetical protein
VAKSVTSCRKVSQVSRITSFLSSGDRVGSRQSSRAGARKPAHRHTRPVSPLNFDVLLLVDDLFLAEVSSQLAPTPLPPHARFSPVRFVGFVS